MLTYLNAKSLSCFFSMFNVALPLHAYPVTKSVTVAISFSFGHFGLLS
jgi:hypothetical protein